MAKPKKKSPAPKPAQRARAKPVAKKKARVVAKKKAKAVAKKKAKVVAKKKAKVVARKAKVVAKKKAQPAQKPAAQKPVARKPAPQPRREVEPDETREKAEGEGDAAFALDKLEDDDVGEQLAEDAVRVATGGAEAQEERDEVVEEEAGGPFVTTSGRTELASGTDASNPEDAEVAALPNVLSEDDDDEDVEDEDESE